MKKMCIQSFLVGVVVLLILSMCFSLIIDFLRFPECYLTTWKYQLQNDLKAGNEKAIEYYEKNYIANGRILFE